ncbi:unnamed protein product [Knipowitschia caucasica]|uniref:4-hydroxyphenylpyruvate dioxygenase n=1 Tax=Knipowitschia caucasica TaxID=637954 RepID=A0AAV2LB80_KNICA
MAAYVQRLHHVSLHVSHADRVARELVSKFKFRPFASRYRDASHQLALRKGRAVFVINDRREAGEPVANKWDFTGVTRETSNYGDGVSSGCLYDVDAPYGVDTVANVCFEVRDVQRSFQTLKRSGCSFPVTPTCVRDDSGVVTYAVVKSVVGNVCHTLIDKSRYEGGFLPGFQLIGEEGEEPEDEACPVTHFDHITYACPQRFTHTALQWYETMFGFKRFFIGSNEDPEEGLVLDQDGIGLRLTAMQYWKCSQRGLMLPSVHQGEPDCKFVIAESLPEKGHNQVDRFLDQHRGPGIQHIGLYTSNILSTAETMSRAGVRFFCPPQAYYTEEEKKQQICAAGLSPELLSRFGILLDTDLRTEGRERQLPRFLLQVFTQPLFSEDTFFLELIERRGASGFGEGNIRALWRSVQRYIEEEDQVEDQDQELQRHMEKEDQDQDQELKSAKR